VAHVMFSGLSKHSGNVMTQLFFLIKYEGARGGLGETG